MKFVTLPLLDALIIEPELLSDERGFFARSWCCREFEERGLNPKLVQCSFSFNTYRGTIRGFHYQTKPYEEAKMVRCTLGSIYDVIIDVRPESATFMKWYGCELSAQNRLTVYIPEGFAHGFQTLEDNSEVFYQMAEFFHPESAKSIRWNDPQFNVVWPIKENITISPKDQNINDFVSSK